MPSADAAPPYSVHVENISGHIWDFVLEFIYTGRTTLRNVVEAEGVITAGRELEISLVSHRLESYRYRMRPLVMDICGQPQSSSNVSS